MAIRTYKVTLDSKNTIAPEPVFLRQGDKTGAVVIDATLMDNGAPVSLDGLTPMFKANTADGQAVIADITGFNIVNASGGEFTYQVPNALAAVPGKIVTAYFSLSDSSGSESTFDVAFVIKKAVDITKPQADEYITIIDGTLKSLQQKIDAMNTDIQTILDAYNQGNFYNKTQTDSKDAVTLSSAKSYADSGDSAVLASAKSYADSGDSAVLASAKSYVNSGAAVGVETFGSEIFTLFNGASWYFHDSYTGLTAMELGNGYRIVQIEFVLKIADYKAAKKNPVVSIPLKYAPKIDWHPIMAGSGSNHVRWNVHANGKIVMESVMNESDANADFWYPMSTIYITHD